MELLNNSFLSLGFIHFDSFSSGWLGVGSLLMFNIRLQRISFVSKLCSGFGLKGKSTFMSST